MVNGCTQLPQFARASPKITHAVLPLLKGFSVSGNERCRVTAGQEIYLNFPHRQTGGLHLSLLEKSLSWKPLESYKKSWILLQREKNVPGKERWKLHFQWTCAVQVFLLSLMIQQMPKNYLWKKDCLKICIDVNFYSSKYFRWVNI